ncbi:DUF6531 domain-containing protein [Candidatus Nitrotoga arctica]|uniref:DUF6531 domain-containing protein n=1 Tax=Candidatus Nitrotoga arctica TaxID=453162 RepID=A0ABM8YY63_9PROT|nr:DUF6531 domain-containing protein [Candidatus Nitrotoga arctica]CAG9932505.1 protein of unknown function [Candidatus Nitrotoga arctica]
MLQVLVGGMRRMIKRIAGTLGLKYGYSKRIQCGFLRRNRGLSTISMRAASSRNRFLGQAPLRIVAMLFILLISLADAQTITSTSGATFSFSTEKTKYSCSNESYTDNFVIPIKTYNWTQCNYTKNAGINVTDPDCHGNESNGGHCSRFIIIRPICLATGYYSNGTTSSNGGNSALYGNFSQDLISGSNGAGLYNQVTGGANLTIPEGGTPPPKWGFLVDVQFSCYVKIQNDLNFSLVGTLYGGNGTTPLPPINSKDPNNNPKASCQAAGTDANAPGIYPAPSSASKDPVDLATGNFYDTLNLLEVAAAGTPLNMALSYSSINPLAGTTGFGWAHPYQHSLVDLTSSVKVIWPDRHVSTYNSNYNPSGLGYTNPAADISDILVKNVNGTYTLTDRRQKTYTFSATGQLLSTKDRFGFIKNLLRNTSQPTDFKKRN